MDASAIIAAVTALLSLVETVLPTLGNLTSSSTVITNIVNALEKWVPIVISEMPSATTLFQAFKNIIASLMANPATPADQLTTLQQLDAQVDTAFEAIAAQTDPDLPTGDPLAPKS